MEMFASLWSRYFKDFNDIRKIGFFCVCIFIRLFKLNSFASQPSRVDLERSTAKKFHTFDSVHAMKTEIPPFDSEIKDSINSSLYRVYQKKLNRFEIALNFAKQPLVSSF